MLLLQLAVQASELVELDANRLAEAAVGDRPQGASDAEQEDADKLCHQVALPWVELGDDQGQDQRRAAERHRQPPVSEAGAGRESEQASEPAQRDVPANAPARVQGRPGQDEQRRGRRKARPEHE